jgi:hypothetical protein
MSSSHDRVASGARAQGDVQLSVTSLFEIKWFVIAVEHERAALEARARAVAAPDGSTEEGVAFEEELKAAMVAVAAAAFAIDAMYVKVHDLLEPAERAVASNRVGFIVRTFEVALALGGRTQPWQRRIPALIDLRDKAVHFRGLPSEPQPHPTGKSNVSLENIIYTAEKATRAVDLALEVLTTAYTSPRAKHTALAAWAAQNSHVPGSLEARRRGD